MLALDLLPAIGILFVAFVIVGIIAIIRLQGRWPRSVYVTIPLFILTSWLFMGYCHGITSGVYPRVLRIHHMLLVYIEKTEGSFPEQENDLIDAGFLKKAASEDGWTYSFRTDPEDNWSRCNLFGKCIIAYGAKVGEIKEVDGKLYRRDTGQQIFLIDGPYHNYLEDSYEDCSLRLYKAMLNTTENADNNPDSV